MDLNDLHLAWRYLHIGLGFVGLAVFWLPICSRKGQRFHRAAGRVFAFCAYVVGATALISSAWAILDPAGFLGVASFEDWPQEKRAQVIGFLQFAMPLLLVLSAGLLFGVRLGTWSLATRSQTHPRVAPSVGALLGLYLAASVYLTGYAAWKLIETQGGASFLVLLIVGILMLLDAGQQWRFVARPRPRKMSWWYKHMECMIGCGIAFYTAFAVFGFGRLFGSPFTGWAAFIPWIVPAAIGIPATVIWTRYYERKFGDRPTKGAKTPEPAAPTQT